MIAQPTYSEEELVALLKQKDNTGYSYLFDHYGGSLYSVIIQIVNDPETANDILQEVFIKIYEHIDRYDAGKGRLFSWMMKISRNTAIDKIRTSYFKQFIKQQPLTGDDHDHPGITPLLDDYGLKKVLQGLKQEHRMLIDLCYYKGFTHDQIAKELDIPSGTVKSRLSIALKQLRTILA